MRISGGTLKGRTVRSQRIFTKKTRGEDLRPTSSKVRQALFNILRGEVRDCIFLDLYAGSGAVGLEALSWGAQKVSFVEESRLRADHITKILLATGMGDKAYVFRGGVMEFLKKAAGEGMQFDIIFADPPYAYEDMAGVIVFIEKYGILEGKGTLMIEHSSKRSLPDSCGLLRIEKTYRYGDTILTLYRRAL